MPPYRQSSFAGGELSPMMWGRDDAAKYREGVRRSRNCLITPTGAIVNRPGTQFVRAVKNSAKKVRLIPFIYSDAQSYILEFGDLYVRFHSYGSTVESSPGVAYELVTPYTEAQVPYLKFSQVGDVLSLAHSAHAPRELRRNSHASWALSTVAFDVPGPTFSGGNPRFVGPLPTADATHPAREWTWKITAIGRDASGFVSETSPFTVTQVATPGKQQWSSSTTYAIGAEVSVDYGGGWYVSLQNGNTNKPPATEPAWWDGPFSSIPAPQIITTVPTDVVVYPDKPVTISWTTSGLVLDTGYRVLAWRVYRGRGQTFGLVGETTKSTFTDYGETLDFSQGPPQGRNPFKVYDYTGTLLRTEEPSVVAHFEQRRVYARTDERQAFVWFSRTDDYDNFDNNVPSVDDEAVELELASRRKEEIRWAVNFAQRLIAGTNSSIWSLGGAGGSALTFASIEAKVQSEVGSSWLDPIVTSGSVLYVRTKGVGVRDLAFSNERGAYAGNDVSALAQHLFQGHQVVSWTWQEDPYGIIWAVREDGVLLSCTYIPEAGIFGWGWHDTQGEFEQVCAVPESTLDAVYVVAKRTVNGSTVRYIERFASRDIDEVEESIFVDSAVTYGGAPITTMTGLSHLNGETVTALADGAVIEDLEPVSGSVSLGLTDGASDVHVGLRYDSDVELLDVPEARTKAKTVSRATIEVVSSKGLQVGEDEDTLEDVKTRVVLDSYATVPLRTEEIEVHIRNTWNKGHGRVFIRQAAPLPLAIIGVTREVSLGGS